MCLHPKQCLHVRVNYPELGGTRVSCATVEASKQHTGGRVGELCGGKLMLAEITHIVCVDGLLCVIFVRKDSYLCLGVYKIIIT